MCELMFPKPTGKKKRKRHPAPIVDTVKANASCADWKASAGSSTRKNTMCFMEVD